MAAPQSERPTETIEQLIERANRSAFEEKKKAESPTAAPLSREEIELLVNDPEGVKRLCKRTLIEIVGNSAKTVALTTAVKELMDRIEGRAPQSIAMTVKADPASTLSDDQLAALLALLSDPLIIPPMPKRIEE